MRLKERGYIKISKPHDTYIDGLLSQFRIGIDVPIMEIDNNNNGTSRYLGKIAKRTGAITIYRPTDNKKKSIITMNGKIKRIQKSSGGTWYELIGEVSLY